MVTSGITHGVSVVSDMWVNPGDVIVLPDMMWGNYNMTFTVRNQAKIVHYKAFDDALTQFNIDDFESVITTEAARTDKIITILNFPHNPSGYSLSRQEADRVADILLTIAQSGTHVVAVCDDAYFGLFFEKETSKESLFAKLAGKHERLAAIKLDGATKEDYVWGFRVGFITYGMTAADPAMMNYLNQSLEKRRPAASGAIFPTRPTWVRLFCSKPWRIRNITRRNRKNSVCSNNGLPKSKPFWRIWRTGPDLMCIRSIPVISCAFASKMWMQNNCGSICSTNTGSV